MHFLFILIESNDMQPNDVVCCETDQGVMKQNDAVTCGIHLAVKDD
jgi:hypothetical protein